ncbi:hypothetical protein [Nostoc sp.]|uniref:hypothetical protein n=1 Tax=Nostoc sp. TaxID=1180 RepID=UPI002FF93A6F
MDDKINELTKKLDEVLRLLPPKDSSKTKILEFAEKLFIPVSLGILAFITSQAGNQISSAQLRLAEAQNNRQAIEAKDNLQTKYIELFYRDISSQDLKKQSAALSLLKLIQPEISKPLLDWASLNVKEELKAETRSIGKEINARIISVLSDYKIMLYFPNSKQNVSETAKNIQQTLVKYGLRENNIILNEKDNDFFQRLGYPTAYEVRYDPGVEDNPAELLISILKESYPSKQFTKRPIGSNTKNSISIFFIE